MKVLIISHNSFLTNDSMGKTLCTLFSLFRKEELCQLYIYPTIPNIDFCSSYYRITDKDVLKGFFTRNVRGRIIQKNEINTTCNLFENKKDEIFYRNPKNHNTTRKLARDFIWMNSPWFNDDLKKWLNEQKITHIFIAPGGYKFIYDVALKCANYLKTPLITYECDEYFFVKRSEKLIENFQQFLLRRKIRQLMSKTSLLITISNELKKLYEPYFSVDACVVMTAASFKIKDKPINVGCINELTYIGSIRYNRYVSLLELGLALDEINYELKTSYQLKIYTEDHNSYILSKLKKAKSIKIMGYVSGKEFEKVFFAAKTLLHIEAFDEKNIEAVKNSISTKIADSLASGIPLLAYAPGSIASMEHLKRNNCAYCIVNRNHLKGDLLNYLKLTETQRNKFVENALLAAHENHELKSVGKKVYDLIANVVK